MSRLQVAEQFVQMAQQTETFGQLFDLLEAVTYEVGFHYFAIINHVDLSCSQKNIIRLENYPRDWAQQFVNQGLYASDPIFQASLTTNAGFFWSDVSAMIKLRPDQVRILQSAGKHGLGDGVTMPANIPGEATGSSSFAVRRGATVPTRNFLLTQIIGAFAFQTARRLNQALLVSPPKLPRLTCRQRDCLLWAIRGKTDWEIAKILGLSEETVSRHLDMARHRYGVTRRLPLAVHAIFDGQISFIEALF